MSTRTSANWAPNAFRDNGFWELISSVVSTDTSRPLGGTAPSRLPSSSRNCRHASTTAEDHDAVPVEPMEAGEAGGSALSRSRRGVVQDQLPVRVAPPD